jgi:hypothetical protein
LTPDRVVWTLILDQALETRASSCWLQGTAMNAAIELVYTPSQALLVLRGEFDLLDHAMLTRRLDDLLALAVPMVMVDSREVTYIDAGSIRAIERARRGQEAVGRRLVVDRASECYRLVARFAGYPELLPPEPSRAVRRIEADGVPSMHPAEAAEVARAPRATAGDGKREGSMPG